MAAQLRTADELLATLGPLSTKETKALLAQLALQTNKTSTARGERDSETWAACVADALSDAIGSSSAGQLVRKEMLAATAWKPVQAFLEEAGFLDLNVREKRAVYQMLARLLVQHADRISSRRDIPLTPHFVASCAGHIGVVFDGAFPGYLASGLAHIVVKRLCVGSRPSLAAA